MMKTAIIDVTGHKTGFSEKTYFFTMNSYLAIKFCIQHYNNMHNKMLYLENVRTGHLPDIAINVT